MKNNWKLVKFESQKARPEKVEFTFRNNLNEERIMVFREKSDWPFIWGMPLEKVEQWICDKYLNDINFATFGAVFS